MKVVTIVEGSELMSNKVSHGWNHVAWHQETQETVLASVIDLPVRDSSLCGQDLSERTLQPEERRELCYYALLADLQVGEMWCGLW